MSERYPTDEELERVKAWPVEDISGWFAFVRSIWWIPEWGWKQDGRMLHISTGGWSGNEDLIDAMAENAMNWGVCWQLSKRGGHYEFQIPEWAAPPAQQESE